MSIIKKIINKIYNKISRASGLYPVQLDLEPTPSCNTYCRMCTRTTSKERDVIPDNAYLNDQVFNKIKPIIPKVRKICFSGFGEPFLHPRYFEYVKQIKSLNPSVFLSLYTNGSWKNKEIIQNIVQSKIDRLNVSIGGAVNKTHRRTHGIDLDKIVNNIHLLNEIKDNENSKTPAVHFNATTSMSSLKELNEIFKMCEMLNIESITMIPLYIYNKSLLDESPWKHIDEARELSKKGLELSKKYSFSYNPPVLVESIGDCKCLFDEIYVLWDGRVFTCGMERHYIGNLMANEKTTIFDIWNGKKIKELRKRYQKEGIKKICPKCSRWRNTADSVLNPHLSFREGFIESPKK